MSYLLILLIIFIMYTVPFTGIIPLSNNEKEIVDMYSSFDNNILDNLIDDSEDGVESVLDGTADFETLSVLGDLDPNNNSDQEYEDIDISKYIK